MAQTKVSLVVEQSTNDDNSTATIHPTLLAQLHLHVGDSVVLKGKRREGTICIVLQDTSMQTTKIRVNSVVRNNIQVKLGDTITITGCLDVKFATKVHILPVLGLHEEAPNDFFNSYLKHYFAGAYRPIKKGDTFLVGLPEVECKIVDMEPADMGIVGPETVIYCEGAPLSREKEQAMNVLYSHIGGLSKQIAEIRAVIDLPLCNPQLYSTLGIAPARGILLHGPSGAGKSLIGRAIANENGAYFIVINGPEILSRYSGESEANLRTAFAAAEKNAPAVIFIDEIDAIGLSKDPSKAVEYHVLSQLLTLMDGLVSRPQNVIVIGATTCPDNLDPSLRRFGRFDYEIEIVTPDTAGRLEILQILTQNMKLSKAVDLEGIARQTDGYVGADLKGLCSLAGQTCICDSINKDAFSVPVPASVLESMEISTYHIQQAIRTFVPTSHRSKK